MPELPDNYAEVLDKAKFRKKFSPVRLENMMEKINAVLKGDSEDEFEGWLPEHARKLKEDLDK